MDESWDTGLHIDPELGPVGARPRWYMYELVGLMMIPTDRPVLDLPRYMYVHGTGYHGGM